MPWPFGVLIAPLVVGVVGAVLLNNGFVLRRQRVNEAWSDIDVHPPRCR